MIKALLKSFSRDFYKEKKRRLAQQPCYWKHRKGQVCTLCELPATTGVLEGILERILSGMPHLYPQQVSCPSAVLFAYSVRFVCLSKYFKCVLL